MSFSSRVKDRLSDAEYVCPKCSLYEAAGMLWQSGAVNDRYIRFRAENKTTAERLKKDIYDAFGIETRVEVSSKTNRIDIDDIYSVENIKGGISPSGDIPFSCCRQAFARGSFLGGGSVTDPEKGYHLEFGSKNIKSITALKRILEIDGFNAKLTQRKGYHVLYVKGSEEIADLLGYMGAPLGALKLYSVQVEKDMRNTVNRRVNCENANTNKSAKASSRHLLAIRKIRNAKKWEKLPDVLKEIGALREEYPEDSLKELGEKTDPPIGKSGVNHRLNRILEIADNI